MLTIDVINKTNSKRAGEIRVTDYDAGQVNYYNVNKTALFIIVKILKLFGLAR